MEQTYTLAEFSTGAWSDRPEYSSDSICWQHVTKLHKARDGFIECVKCGDTDYWCFLHIPTGVVFEYFLYGATSWEVEGGAVREAEPFMWIYGTTFDGVRECSGGQNFSGNLSEMAEALTWVHSNACSRWPRFNEWYQR